MVLFPASNRKVTCSAKALRLPPAYSVTPQKFAFFIVITVKPSNPKTVRTAKSP
jgi:hypothetical protein